MLSPKSASEKNNPERSIFRDILYTNKSDKQPDFFVYRTCTSGGKSKPHMPWDVLDDPDILKIYEKDF